MPYRDDKSSSSSIWWLLANALINNSFVKHLRPIRELSEEKVSDHVPSVAIFERAIKSDPEMVDLFDHAFLQASSQNEIPDFDSLLYIIDRMIVAPPEFQIYRDEHGNRLPRPFGLPICLLFTYLCNTSAGYDLFRKPAFNTAMKTLLDSWGLYLTTKDSAKLLTDCEGGWFSEEALQEFESDSRGKFEETYVCPDPDAVNRGFSSWDAFFTREVQPNARPVEAPYDKSVIHNPCESYLHCIARDVKCHDLFWLKGNIYSLYDMLNRDHKLAKQFVGGTIYQGFLSPVDYHRWRSPVDGTIKKTEIVAGTYYAALPDAGAPEGNQYQAAGDLRGALKRSQTWLAMVAARALVYIEADNPDIGLVCFIAVGMVEVSTCEVTVKRGQKVSAGSELGMFHFGGSSFVLVFGPQACVTFPEDVVLGKHVKLNSILARVHKA
ncbi:phosphatidylserine decarboxylase [Amanita muscaria]